MSREEYNHAAKPTREETTQTYDTAWEIQETINTSDQSPFPSLPDSVLGGPDQTARKEVADEPRETDNEMVNEEVNRERYQNESTDGDEQEISLHPSYPPTESVTSPAPSIPGYLDRSESSGLSSVAKCDTCSAAFESLICSSSKGFWAGIKSTECCEKVWQHFSNRLKEMFPQEFDINKDKKRVMKMLKALLGISGTLDRVTISKYLRLVTFIGPFRLEDKRCVVLKQLEDLVSNSFVLDPNCKKRKLCWFAGPMSRDEAEIKLKGQPPGTFLIRMSGTEEEVGNFVLSLVMADRNIEHFLLEGNHEEAIRSTPFSLCLEFRSKIFSSLPELVNGHLRVEEICDADGYNAMRCRNVCPDLPFNQIIIGYAK